MMRMIPLIITISLTLVGCTSTPEPEAPVAQILGQMIREGRFDEAKSLIDQKSQSDPIMHWKKQLGEADKLWERGMKEECLREYEAFFHFCEGWNTRSQNH